MSYLVILDGGILSGIVHEILWPGWVNVDEVTDVKHFILVYYPAVCFGSVLRHFSSCIVFKLSHKLLSFLIHHKLVNLVVLGSGCFIFLGS
jgi:hypothetical protein